MIEISTLISAIVALITTFLTLYFTRRFWLLTHRPIITAEIVESASGVGVAVFDLAIYNSGNRPAININISAENKDLEKIFTENASESGKETTREVFSPSNKIALLLNGKNTKTHFGAFSNIGCNADILIYEAELPIHITYKDIEGRDYNENMVLYIRAAEGFGGAV